MKNSCKLVQIFQKQNHPEAFPWFATSILWLYQTPNMYTYIHIWIYKCIYIININSINKLDWAIHLYPSLRRYSIVSCWLIIKFPLGCMHTKKRIWSHKTVGMKGKWMQKKKKTSLFSRNYCICLAIDYYEFFFLGKSHNSS